MEEILKQILTKLEKLDKMELDITAIKCDVKQIDKNVDNIIEVAAKTMEDVTELKEKSDRQKEERRVIKGVR